MDSQSSHPASEGPGPAIRAVIVDDHELFSISLGAWLARQSDITLIGQAKDGEAGLRLCLEAQPDLALVDVVLPKLDGFGLTLRLKEQAPSVRVLMVSGRIDPYIIWRVSQCGADGYIEKTANPALLLTAVRAVAAGDEFFSPTFQAVKREWLAQPEAFQKILSSREQEVLLRVVVGWDDERIAAELGISLQTVVVHRKNLRRKLGAHNDRDLIAYARAWGLGEIT